MASRLYFNKKTQRDPAFPSAPPLEGLDYHSDSSFNEDEFHSGNYVSQFLYPDLVEPSQSQENCHVRSYYGNARPYANAPLYFHENQEVRQDPGFPPPYSSHEQQDLEDDDYHYHPTADNIYEGGESLSKLISGLLWAPFYVIFYPIKWLLKYIVLAPLLAPYYVIKNWYLRVTYIYHTSIYFYPSLMRLGLLLWERVTGQQLGPDWDEYRGGNYSYGYRDQTGRLCREQTDLPSILKSILSGLLWIITAGYLGGLPSPLSNSRFQDERGRSHRQQPKSFSIVRNIFNGFLWIISAGYLGGFSSPLSNSRHAREKSQGRMSQTRSGAQTEHRIEAKHQRKENIYLKLIIFAVIAFIAYYLFFIT